MKQVDIFEFFRRLAEDNPSPETELEFGNTYQLLVAVVLSAQSTDVGVNKATRALFQTVKTPAQMVALGEDGLKQHIKTIGLFNSKAKNVIALSEILVRDFAGEVPADRDVLTSLPGVAEILQQDYEVTGADGRKIRLSQLIGKDKPALIMCHPAVSAQTDDAIGAARKREFAYLASHDFVQHMLDAGVRLVRGSGKPIDP